MKHRITIPFETLRSWLPETLDLLPNPIEFRAVVKGAIVSESKDWVGIGFTGDDEPDGTERILIIDEETMHAEIRAARAKAPKMPVGNYDRLWLRCPRCFRYQYVDYVPFSLSNPIRVPACNHGRYEDLDEVVTFEQRVGKSRVGIKWHDLMDVLDERARNYIDGLKPKNKKAKAQHAMSRVR